MLRYSPSFTRSWNTSFRVALPATTLLVWGVVAFSAATWGLRWSAASDGLGLAAVATPITPDVDVSAVARSLGAAPVQATAAPTLVSRFQLQGVMDAGQESGAALIAVDGKPAKPYRVGAVVADGLVLQSAQGRRVSLGASIDAPSTVVLELPAKR